MGKKILQHMALLGLTLVILATPEKADADACDNILVVYANCVHEKAEGCKRLKNCAKCVNDRCGVSLKSCYGLCHGDPERQFLCSTFDVCYVRENQRNKKMKEPVAIPTKPRAGVQSEEKGKL